MKLWCVGFNEFEELAKRKGWHLEVPSNIAVISINNGEDAGNDTEYHICEDDVNVLNLNFDDVDPISNGLPEDIETPLLVERKDDTQLNRAIEILKSK